MKIARYRLLPTIKAALSLSLLGFSCMVQADYLSELEAEAKSTGTQAEQPDASAWTPDKQGIASGLRKGMTHEEFEKSLHDNYYGSFLFYDKLSQWNKKQVFDVYQKSNDIEQVRNEIKSRMTK